MTNSGMQDNPANTIRAAFEHLILTTTHAQRLQWIATATKRVPRERIFVADTSTLDDIFNSGCKWITLSNQVFIYPMTFFAGMIIQINTGAPIVEPIQI